MKPRDERPGPDLAGPDLPEPPKKDDAGDQAGTVAGARNVGIAFAILLLGLILMNLNC